MDKAKKAFAINALRRASYRWHTRYKAIKKAHIGRNEYVCQTCGQIVGSKQKQLDHTLPVVPVTGWEGFDSFIERMFPHDAEGYKVLCIDCHDVKTKIENEERRKYKQD